MQGSQRIRVTSLDSNQSALVTAAYSSRQIIDRQTDARIKMIAIERWRETAPIAQKEKKRKERKKLSDPAHDSRGTTALETTRKCALTTTSFCLFASLIFHFMIIWFYNNNKQIFRNAQLTENVTKTRAATTLKQWMYRPVVVLIVFSHIFFLYFWFLQFFSAFLLLQGFRVASSMGFWPFWYT